MFSKYEFLSIVQPDGVKKKLNCALWDKSIKLGTVIVQVVATIFSYGPHSNMCVRGEAHCALGGRGHGLFVLVRKRLKEGRKAV